MAFGPWGLARSQQLEASSHFGTAFRFAHVCLKAQDSQRESLDANTRRDSLRNRDGPNHFAEHLIDL
jgi:hypothetical protein